jgi:predicted HTH domain antitoxin
MDKEYLDYLSRIQKVVLMLLYLDASPIRGKTWYQKEIFLISKLDKEMGEELEFEPHNYGPHSYEADDALENLKDENLIEVIDNNEIKITKSGEEAAKYLKNSFKQSELDFYKEIKLLLNDLSRMELLTYIYQTNKDMTTESVELNNVRNRLVYYSISLYKKKKLSLAKAAEISELKLDDFIKELKKRKISIETGI